MDTPKEMWSYGWRILALSGIFLFLIVGAATLSGHLGEMAKIAEMEAMTRIPEGYAEFEVLIAPKTTGDAIYATLRVADEDISKFFKGHTWTLLPPPEEVIE